MKCNQISKPNIYQIYLFIWSFIHYHFADDWRLISWWWVNGIVIVSQSISPPNRHANVLFHPLQNISRLKRINCFWLGPCCLYPNPDSNSHVRGIKPDYLYRIVCCSALALSTGHSWLIMLTHWRCNNTHHNHHHNHHRGFNPVILSFTVSVKYLKFGRI